MSVYTEDNLVQKTTAEYLVGTLGWNESVYAMQEVFGAAGTLGARTRARCCWCAICVPLSKN